jgi:imidazolonepropionase-like amidohydrolase
MRQDDLVGSIEVGKRADLVVLDRNLVETPGDVDQSGRGNADAV